MSDLVTEIATSYSRTGAAWQAGPGRVYDALAERTLAAVPVRWPGRLVVDVGAGTGAMTRAVRRAGAVPIAVDHALGMLTAAPARARVPSIASDARRLPLGTDVVDGWLAACCLNHLPDAELALAEAARVVRRGGPIVASSYAADDGHPVKGVVERVAAAHGWVAPAWTASMMDRWAPRVAGEDAALRLAERAGLVRAQAVRLVVPLPQLDAAALVAWRTGMAQMAPWMATLDHQEQASIRREAAEHLRGAPPLERRLVVLLAVSP